MPATQPASRRLAKKKKELRLEGSCDPAGWEPRRRHRNYEAQEPAPSLASSSIAWIEGGHSAAASCHPGAQPPRSCTPLGSPPPAGSQKNSPGGGWLWGLGFLLLLFLFKYQLRVRLPKP